MKIKQTQERRQRKTGKRVKTMKKGRNQKDKKVTFKKDTENNTVAKKCPNA